MATSAEITRLDVCACSSVTTLPMFQAVAPPTPLLEELSAALNQLLEEENSQETFLYC